MKALLAVLALGAAAPSAGPVLNEQVWTQAGPGLAHALTHAPPECLAHAGRADVELGRALFRSPVLLGGPVARIGISCASCHQNGRANPHFLLQELTDRPGHADVTSEWSSAVRGDGVNNPRRIPDLVDVGARRTFGSDGETSLPRFVRSVIVEEFQGAPPPAPAFEAIVAYLQALRSKNCPVAEEAPLMLGGAAQDVRRALDAAWAVQGDPATRSLALVATQQALGRIVERLPAASFAPERRALQDLSLELGAAREGALEAQGWRVRFDAVIARAERRERRTYFDESTLGAALAAPNGKS